MAMTIPLIKPTMAIVPASQKDGDATGEVDEADVGGGIRIHGGRLEGPIAGGKPGGAPASKPQLICALKLSGTLVRNFWAGSSSERVTK